MGIAGLGTLGGETLRHLAMLGVPMVLLDRGMVEPENLGTQGFAADHVGLSKVKAGQFRAPEPQLAFLTPRLSPRRAPQHIAPSEIPPPK